MSEVFRLEGALVQSELFNGCSLTRPRTALAQSSCTTSDSHMEVVEEQLMLCGLAGDGHCGCAQVKATMEDLAAAVAATTRSRCHSPRCGDFINLREAPRLEGHLYAD